VLCTKERYSWRLIGINYEQYAMHHERTLAPHITESARQATSTTLVRHGPAAHNSDLRSFCLVNLLLERLGVEDGIFLVNNFDGHARPRGLVATFLHDSKRAPERRTPSVWSTLHSPRNSTLSRTAHSLAVHHQDPKASAHCTIHAQSSRTAANN